LGLPHWSVRTTEIADRASAAAEILVWEMHAGLAGTIVSGTSEIQRDIIAKTYGL
jgi:hypothetical protein